jgi:hypothetical protein
MLFYRKGTERATVGAEVTDTTRRDRRAKVARRVAIATLGAALALEVLAIWPGANRKACGADTWVCEQGWIFRDTGNYNVGQFTMTGFGGWSCFGYEGDGLRFKHDWDATSWYCMGWIGKNSFGSSPTYPARVSALTGTKNVTYNSQWVNASGTRQMGVHVWLSTAQVQNGTWTDEVMVWDDYTGINFDWSQWVSDYYDASGQKYWVFKWWNTGEGGHWSYGIYRVNKRTSGSIDVKRVLDYLRTNHGLGNNWIHEVKLTTECWGGSKGRWQVNSVSIPNLN